ncbi:MAG: hypothetical protein U0610_10110 [bacterium]
MPIYFPRGFNSGEPVRVVDGVTVVRGSLAKQSAALRVVAGARGALGALAGPGSATARRVLDAAAPGMLRRLRTRPRRPGSLHLFDLPSPPTRWLGFFEYREVPRTLEALAEAVADIERHAAERGVTEVAIAPFGGAPADAERLVRVLGDRNRGGQPAVRWIVVVADRAQFEAATAAGVKATSP